MHYGTSGSKALATALPWIVGGEAKGCPRLFSGLSGFRLLMTAMTNSCPTGVAREGPQSALREVQPAP